MGQVLHGSATTTEGVRRALQSSQEPENAGLALWHQSEDGCQLEEAALIRPVGHFLPSSFAGREKAHTVRPALP